MKCPKCRGIDSAVVESRPRAKDTQRWRRHECKRCGWTWGTVEIPETRLRELEKARRKHGL